MKRATLLFVSALLIAFTPAMVFANSIAPDTLPEGVDEELAQPVEVEESEVEGETEEVVEEETVVSGDVSFVADEYVNIAEEKGSDLYTAGNTIIVSSDVHGDVFAAANDVTLGSDVHGDARVAANTIIVKGTISGNTLLAANTIIIEEAANIEGNANLYGSTVTINGSIAKTATIAAATANLNGSFKGKIDVTSEETIVGRDASIHTPSTITANLLGVDRRASGTQYIEYTKPAEESFNKNAKKRSAHLQQFRAFVRSYFLFAAIGVILILLWPKWSQRSVEVLNTRPKESFWKGAIITFATPAAVIFFTFTIVGIPLAVFGGLAYMIILAMGRLVVGLWLGQMLVNEAKLKANKQQIVLCFIVGYFLLSVLMYLPIVGWIFTILAALWGAGAILESHKNRGKRTKRATTTKRKTTTRKKSSKSAKKTSTKSKK